MTQAELLSVGPIGVGTRARILQPGLRPAIWEVTEWKPGRSFAWKTTVMGADIVADHVLESKGAHCQFSQSVNYRGIIGSILGALTSACVL